MVKYWHVKCLTCPFTTHFAMFGVILKLKNSSQNFRYYSFASKIYSGIQSKKVRQNNEQSNAKGARFLALSAMKK